MNPAEQVLCAATARWLAATTAVFGALGLGAAAGAVLLLVARVPQPAWAACALLLLLAERVLALRTRFDAGLFADLALGPACAGLRRAADLPKTTAPTEPLQLLDAALASLRLRPAAAAPRSLVQRVQGARRLSLQHGLLATLQCVAVGVQLLLSVGGGSP